MTDSRSDTDRQSKAAGWLHVGMAAIVALAMTMVIHVSDASPDVAGAGYFLLLTWLGLPALLVGSAAIYYSHKSQETDLQVLSVVLFLLVVSMIAGQRVVAIALAVIYGGLAIRRLFWHRRHGASEAG